VLERNRELYRYEETDREDLENVLGEYLSGQATFGEVLSAARSRSVTQQQSVSQEQVGTVEAEIPAVVNSPVAKPPVDGEEFDPAPPILRLELVTDKKILTTQTKYPQLNNFAMLLGVSDRLMQYHGAFLQSPHTTRILWGGHRVIYIFTEPLAKLSLYYDMELKDSLGLNIAGGGMFPSTTLITKSRIYVPVPEALVPAFKIEGGKKEFFVRFDVLTSL
jgi:molecular chaperone HtpG